MMRIKEKHKNNNDPYTYAELIKACCLFNKSEERKLVELLTCVPPILMQDYKQLNRSSVRLLSEVSDTYADRLFNAHKNVEAYMKGFD